MVPPALSFSMELSMGQEHVCASKLRQWENTASTKLNLTRSSSTGLKTRGLQFQGLSGPGSEPKRQGQSRYLSNILSQNKQKSKESCVYISVLNVLPSIREAQAKEKTPPKPE